MNDLEQSLLMEGFDDALLGFGSQAGRGFLAIYSHEKMLDVCVNSMGMDHKEATEHLAYNVLFAYMGEKTPIILTVVPSQLEGWFQDGEQSDTENAETAS